MGEVLISIQPKWCELIASGKKTVEIRKTRPKIDTPFKCYIYETKAYDALFGKGKPKKLCVGGGRVIGEFVCDRIYDVIQFGMGIAFGDNGLIIEPQEMLNKACLTETELEKYFESSGGYAWHISDLVIYDKPKELSEFSVLDNKAIKECEHRERVYQNPDYANGAWLFGGCVCHKGEIDWCCDCKRKPLKRPPQSWCYVELLKGGAE